MAYAVIGFEKQTIYFIECANSKYVDSLTQWLDDNGMRIVICASQSHICENNTQKGAFHICIHACEHTHTQRARALTEKGPSE